MVLPVPETKIREHFYRSNTPPKPEKNHIGNTFLPLESGFFGHFIYFAYFGPVFRV